MTALPPREQRLRAALDYVGEQKRAGADAAAIIRGLMREHGATYRPLAWTNTLRAGGTTASCTSSKDKGLLDAWVSLANRHYQQFAGSVAEHDEVVA